MAISAVSVNNSYFVSPSVLRDQDRAVQDLDDSSSAPAGKSPDHAKLDQQKQAQVRELARRDLEVRAHEMAHSAAGGQYVRGGASYSYQTGPDGKSYAVGGEVSIDTSPVPNNPRATIQKMQTVQRAAMAPASPSGQDRAVAAAASGALIQAQMELAQGKGQGSSSPTAGASASRPSERTSSAGTDTKSEISGRAAARYAHAQQSLNPPAVGINVFG